MTIRIATLAATALVIAAPSAFAEQNISKRVTVSADVSVDVSNVAGRVDVTAWDRNEVELTAFLESDKDKLEYEATERQVRITVKRPESRHWGGDEDEDAILTLRVPKSARLTVDTVSADIAAQGMRGAQRLGSVSGSIETQAHDAPVSLRSVSGEVTVAGSGHQAQLRTENVSGTTVVTGVRGRIEAKAVSGDIEISTAAASELTLGSVSGDIRAGAELAADARVDMETISGTVEFTIKPPVNAEFDLESFSGDIESCFGGKARAVSKYGPGSELRMTQGSGSARVRIQTLSGDVTICDR